MPESGQHVYIIYVMAMTH